MIIGALIRILTILFLFFCGCRTSQKGISYQVPKEAPVNGCIIKGVIVSIPAVDADTGICAKYPCRARVRIADIISCGSSVSLFFNVGDTLEIQFAYTLSNTRKVFPAMQEQYPGLQKGNVFTAVALQRMRPGTGEYFVVYGYKVE